MCVKRADIGARTGALVAFLVVAVLGLTSVPALALSEGRVYEMVSPLYKGGYGASALGDVAPDGESVVFESLGAFSGAPASHALNYYVSRRGVSGWSTVSLVPPASVLPDVFFPVPIDFSPNLEMSLTDGARGTSLGAANDHRREIEFLLRQTGTADVPASYSVAGKVLKALKSVPFTPAYLGASADFSHILFETTGEPLLPLATSSSVGQLYDFVTSGDGAPGLRLVDLNDSGELIDPDCKAVLGAENGGGSMFNAIATDGSEIFFTTSTNLTAGGNCDRGGGENVPLKPSIVFVRVDGERTLEVSAPLAVDCRAGAPCASAAQARAVFDGANETGSCAFFMTTQPLVTGDTDSGNDLYVTRIGHPGESGSVCAPDVGGTAGVEVTSLAQVSRGPNTGEAADVQGVVAVSPDGSRVYFIAHGTLSEGPNVEGRTPVRGADNLYVDETGTGKPPVFVAELCSGPGESGEVSDAQCPSDLTHGTGGRNDNVLWSGAGERQTAGDGRFLLFSTYDQLSPGDTDAARDVYRYDALTGRLDRVSIGEAGHDTNGNDSAFDAAITQEEASNANSVNKGHANFRAISENGSRVVFTTAEPLSPDATNGLENVYEWHIEPGWSEGRVSLISTGHSTQRANEVLMSASGRDVFFITSEGLVSGDTDGAPDVYDARLGGGFPEPAVEREPCAGDACQGPLTNPAPLLVPGSVSQAPGENAPAPASAPPAAAKSKAKAKPKHRARHRNKASKRQAKAKRSMTEARR